MEMKDEYDMIQIRASAVSLKDDIKSCQRNGKELSADLPAS